jgi:myo-inositol 2-dehydrogenase / D-chiro-inositol 1-dehydrogenase
VWVMGKAPVKAVGMGARVRRQTGDQYDFFSVDYTFDDGVHMHSTIRQLRGCANERDESLVGTKGTASLDQGAIFDRAGKVVWKFSGEGNDSLIQEHADWVAAIRADKPINTAKDTAISTLVAIMGRESAYTGKAVAYDEMLASTVRLGPERYALGPVAIPAVPPLAGQDSAPLSE